jgi:serine/threonine protein kinase/tetratricopeptide (TPR) repeat protein
MSQDSAVSIPGYRLLREIGRGGMGSVWLAVQESLGREVALKLLSPHLSADPLASERFLREARIAAKLVHRHIVGIHDVGVHAGQPYLAMEYMPGGTVAPAEGEAMAPREALEVVRQIALALDRAHRDGVIHRDLKPENILRRADGSYALADFGIARTLDAPGGALTQENTTLGTPYYMSPEQLQALPLDGRSDLYGLGVVLYQLLTGRLPYRGTADVPVGIQHINAPIPQLPPQLATSPGLVDLLLAKSPAARPADGAELARRIEALQAGATPLSTPTLALSSHSTLPASPRRAAKWVGPGLAVLALVVLAGLLWPHLPVPERRSADAAQAPVAATRAADKSSESSIAVLPLRNEGGEAEDVYFSDGLSEDLITALGQLEGVRVISRNSSFRFRDANEASERIAGQLGVAYLVEGSVRRAGDAVRLNISLVRGSDGSTAWSQRFDRPYRDLFALQDEIVEEVTRALGARLRSAPLPADVFDRKSGGGPAAFAEPSRPQRDKPPSGNIAAYEAFLRGNHELERRNEAGTTAAIAHYREAVQIDPAYATAWAMLGIARYSLGNFYSVTPSQRTRLNSESEEAAANALRLDPESARARHARGLVRLALHRDLAGAEKELRRALELAPQDAGILSLLAGLLGQAGRVEEALPIAREAIAADPLSADAHYGYARTLQAAARYKDAESEYLKVLALRPESSAAHAFIALVRAVDGRPAAAIAAAKAEPDPFWRDYALAIAYRAAGRPVEADALLAKLEREHAGDAAFQIAELHAQRGDRAGLFRWLEVARTSGDGGVVEALGAPLFFPYHDDPRFAEFCRKIGLPAPTPKEN